MLTYVIGYTVLSALALMLVAGANKVNEHWDQAQG